MKLNKNQVDNISKTIAAMLIDSFDSFGFDYSELSQEDIERINNAMFKIAYKVRGNRPSNIGSTTEIVKYFTKKVTPTT